METFSDDQFERLLEGLDQPPDLEAFDPFCDPTLIPSNDVDLESFLCFPPLPPIEEESVPSLSAVPTLADDSSVSSVTSTLPEGKEAIAIANCALNLVKAQQAEQDALRREIDALKETLGKIRTYQLECLNPWIMQVQKALGSLGILAEELPASATDGEFDLSLIDRP